MLFGVLARKAYARNLQYRLSHALNTAASALFGFVFVSVWASIGAERPLGEYGTDGMITYIAFNQACFSVTLFVTNGLGLDRQVRTGQISLDLMRPVPLFAQLLYRECGQLGYQLVYKAVPIFALYALTLPLVIPSHPGAWLLTTAAVILAAYINICINYLIGALALWSTESRWLYWINLSASAIMAGGMIPLEWLPQWLQRISAVTPYPYMQYMPARLFLQMENGLVLLPSLAWCAALTLVCIGMTGLLRRKVEVQGG